MALAFKSIGTAFTTASASTFTANVPTSVVPASGDLLVAIGMDWAGSGVTWTTPSGWAVVRNDNDGGTGDIGVHVYSKIATGTDTNQNFTLSVAESGVMVMLCYSGQDATTPIDVSGASVTDPSTASNTMTTPVVTTTVANDILLLIYAHGSDSNNSATVPPVIPLPSTTTQRLATTSVIGGAATWQQLMLCDVVQAASGASAQFSSASTGNAPTTYGAAAIAVAIKAAATGGTVVEISHLLMLGCT